MKQDEAVGLNERHEGKTPLLVVSVIELVPSAWHTVRDPCPLNDGS